MAIEYLAVVAAATTNKYEVYEQDKNRKGEIHTLVFSNEISFLDHYGEDNWTLRKKEPIENKIETKKVIRYIFSRPKQQQKTYKH